MLGWAAAYAGGVVPVDLPPITAPPPLGDRHLETSIGLGPGLPANLHGLPSTDHLRGSPLIDLGGSPHGSAGPPAQPGGPDTPATAESRTGDS